MARSNNFFGLRRGSTKSLTFQVYRGQQITKDRVSDVSNPQSTAQMQQRLKVPLVASARAALKTLVNHSFEGTTYGEESLKLFSSLNLAKGALTVQEYVPKSAMDCGLADFIISRGSLASVTTGFIGRNMNRVQVRNLTQSSTWPTDWPALEENAAITEGLLTKICDYIGLATGEQLTYLLCVKGASYSFDAGDEGEVEGHYHSFVISRLINDITKMGQWKLSSATTADATSISITDGYIEITVNSKDQAIMDSNLESISNATKACTIKNLYIPAGGDEVIEGVACIYSRETDGVWRRSSQRLNCLVPNDKTQDFDSCLPSYIKSTSESNKYLNTGTAGVDINGGTTSSTTNS